LYAVLVGYSRIYLAQHFPLDVGGGMLTAVITILVAVFIQNIWEARIEKQELKK
jgi:membrane-associated phospholipid phosphatase